MTDQWNILQNGIARIANCCWLEDLKTSGLNFARNAGNLFRGKVGEVESMKYPGYDSPIELTISDITTQMARNIDEACWQATQRVGINVDKEKMLSALKQDAERYREAFSKGRDTGYVERDEEIVRCKDCKYHDNEKDVNFCDCGNRPDDWFCADGKRREDDA